MSILADRGEDLGRKFVVVTTKLEVASCIREFFSLSKDEQIHCLSYLGGYFSGHNKGKQEIDDEIEGPGK